MRRNTPQFEETLKKLLEAMPDEIRVIDHNGVAVCIELTSKALNYVLHRRVSHTSQQWVWERDEAWLGSRICGLPYFVTDEPAEPEEEPEA